MVLFFRVVPSVSTQSVCCDMSNYQCPCPSPCPPAPLIAEMNSQMCMHGSDILCTVCAELYMFVFGVLGVSSLVEYIPNGGGCLNYGPGCANSGIQTLGYKLWLNHANGDQHLRQTHKLWKR